MGPRPLGFATVSILEAIHRRRAYGLDLIDETGLGGGTVYKLLRRLESRGLVRGQWEAPETAERERRPRRRYYELTSEGERALSEAVRQMRSLTERHRVRADQPLPEEG
jgi:DNA-binding PadR family transcriptional regulator